MPQKAICLHHAQTPETMIELLFPARIARAEFCIRLVFLVVTYAVATFLTVWLAEGIGAVPNGDLLIIGAILVTIITVVCFFFLSTLIPRLRDIGLPHWYLVFYFVPVLNLILFVLALAAPSDSWGAKENAAGSSVETNERQESPPPGLSEDPY